MKEKQYRDIRKIYGQGSLSDDIKHEDPKELLSNWISDAVGVSDLEPTAMILSTVDTEGQPSSRTLLLKEIDEGLVFYTNYHSKKGEDVESNNKVSLLFFWKKLERQVRVQGTIEKVSEEQSIEYFQSRPKGSQLGAWASPQSQEIAGRSTLEDRLAELSDVYKDRDVLPKPAHWGGYRVIPNYFEFWQGRDNRLHDRFAYKKEEGSWAVTRLAP